MLPWQPFHRIIEQVYFPAERTHVWVDVAKHSTNLFAFLKCARRYFADAATEEILDEFRPSLVPFQESVYKTQGYLVRLLPVDVSLFLVVIRRRPDFGLFFILIRMRQRPSCGSRRSWTFGT